MLSETGMQIARNLADLDEVKGLAKTPAIATTKNHYAHYARVISNITDVIGAEGQTRVTRIIVGEALKLAGANKDGVDDALWAVYGESDYDPMARMFGAEVY